MCNELVSSLFDVCISTGSLVIGVIVVLVIAGIAVWLGRKSDDELNQGGQFAIPTTTPSYEERAEEEPQVCEEDEEDEEEEGIKDQSSVINVKKGDKLPFGDWVLEVTGVDDDEERIYGNLHVTLPPGAKYRELMRQSFENYPMGDLGFTVVCDPIGPAVASTIDYDPDPDDPPMYEDYTMRVESILVFESDLPAS